MSKITKNERISTLEDAVATNWSDMKKIETKISRAMTDMATRISNISLQLEGQQRQIHLAAESIGLNKQAIIILENKAKPDPQLKQLDQSVFDGLDEKWRFAAVDDDGRAYYFMKKPVIDQDDPCFIDGSTTRCKWIGEGYDASNWQNSLIERDEAELTGSDLCRAMLARGDKWVVCAMADTNESDAIINSRPRLVTHYANGFFEEPKDMYWHYAVPINNQGEPLTQAEAGL